MEISVKKFNSKTALRDSELESCLTHCIFCGSDDLVNTGVVMQLNPRVTYLKCKSCFVKLVDRQPTSHFLNNFYQPEKYLGSIAGSATKAKRFARRILDSRVQQSLQSQSESPRILDFGGGSGQLGIALRDRLARADTTATVSDIHPPIHGLNLEFLPNSKLHGLTNQKFHLIVASAVVEHLKHPDQVLQDLYSACSDGGFLYFRVPSNFPLGRIFRRILSFPDHLSHLGPQFWDEIPRLLNWSVELIYSRPSISDSSVRDNAVSALGSKAFKIPAMIEVAFRSRLTRHKVARYECAGAWEVMYRKTIAMPITKDQ